MSASLAELSSTTSSSPSPSCLLSSVLSLVKSVPWPVCLFVCINLNSRHLADRLSTALVTLLSFLLLLSSSKLMMFYFFWYFFSDFCFDSHLCVSLRAPTIIVKLHAYLAPSFAQKAQKARTRNQTTRCPFVVVRTNWLQPQALQNSGGRKI